METKLATIDKAWKQSWLPLAKRESKVGYHLQSMKAKLATIGKTWKQSWLPLAKHESKLASIGKHESKVGCH